jgi:hypothetical protein
MGAKLAITFPPGVEVPAEAAVCDRCRAKPTGP